MKAWLIPALATTLLFTGCGGDDQQNSGTILLTNELYASGSYYYSLGLSFAEGKAVPTLPDPNRYDIIVQAGNEPFLSANTLTPPFALIGEYSTESEAKSAFAGLKSVGSVSYIDLAAPLKKNQVWVVKTRDYNYAKLRIIDVTLDVNASPPFASCKFEWVYQPDGSTQFP
ncbi:MAG: hypothetical protein WCD55_02925 [Bacteroidales bacterium]